MKQHSKLSSEQQQDQVAAHASQQTPEREFASAEELLRFDAAQTAVPAAIAERLRKSSATLPKPKNSWWKRWFGGANP